MKLQTCRRHPSAQFALSCPGCKQELHDRQYPEYAISRPRTALDFAAITAVGLAVIVGPQATTDPAVAYQLAVIDAAHPEIAKLEADLTRRGWLMNDTGMWLAWRLDRARMDVHIAEERLLDLYGMPRRSESAEPDAEQLTCEACGKRADDRAFRARANGEIDDDICDECLAVQADTAQWDAYNAHTYYHR